MMRSEAKRALGKKVKEKVLILFIFIYPSFFSFFPLLLLRLRLLQFPLLRLPPPILPSCHLFPADSPLY